MSLISYPSREGREIVLRHQNAIVVRDPDSQRLEIRGLTECPTCHQALRPPSPDRHGFESSSSSSRHEYVDPDYFRMLRAGLVRSSSSTRHDEPPSSPILRMIRPGLPQPHPQSARVEDVEDIDFFPSPSSAQAPVHQGGRIRREAFSPNYFNTFFVEERELGRGGKGVVLLVRHEIDGCHLGHFACKRVPVGDDHAWLEKVLVEVELLAKLSHPNLVSYRHVWLEDVQLSRFGPRVACAFILQQYCNGGDLLNYVVGDRPKETTKEDLKEQMRRRSRGQAEQPSVASLRHLSFEEIYSLFRDVTSGLAYLHAANYIHRDLKPSNCLLHREGTKLTCLISDFGEVQAENVVRKSTGTTGTISYCAPEVLKMDASGRYGNFTTKSDIFSLGMILYFLCFSRLPYQSANAVHEELEDVDELRAEITDWKGFKDERRERSDLPSKLYQLLRRLLALDPAHRPSANEVLAAMKSESYPEGVPLTARSSSPSIGLQGRRVQNLDSPGPPGTPVPGS
ncbi:kinase-like protein [Sodiomyces alkalinus F11]|uniref:non-specific serine/threonine protein kinase n=1 Tax=Sodiomyces alkalinus (strain CBS 110278 / VKM F-3762 / F11) TaxID=1314773 RepID=A0A3N2PP97_SODAK|nr:kinase-like protein [Sodiomyces alkalinus F11]ROT36338.1 kinase-like protein [Sodiomyces alkalinus F11]